MTATDENTAIAVDVMPGQIDETSSVEPTLDATMSYVPKIKQAVADNDFDGKAQRQAFPDRNIQSVIPRGGDSTKSNSLDKQAYRSPNMIERLFDKLRQFGRSPRGMSN